MSIQKTTAAIKQALEQPTLIEALEWIIIWEHKRVLATFLTPPRHGPDNTSFGFVMKEVIRKWRKKNDNSQLA